MYKLIVGDIIHLIYPRRCCICQQFSKNPTSLCHECSSKLEPISVKTCARCGMPIKNCECFRFIYHFSGLASPFENRDAMKQGIYHFKFSGNVDAAEVYGKYMSDAVQKKFDTITFDLVCAVPMHPIDRMKRGYNQADLLAKQIAQNLDLKHSTTVIKKIKRTPAQHTLSTEKRFSNVRNLYIVQNRRLVLNKNILLIDDIKTTGATLDECARQLMLAGAAKVFCATALVTIPDFDN